MSSLEVAKRPLPTTLIIDSHDSYTRNLLSLISRLGSLDSITPGDADAAAPWDCQGWKERVVIVSVDSLDWDSFTTDLLPYLDCVILGPGPGTPHNENDFSWPHRLIEELGDRLPVFGLCLGCQGLATVFGGKVVPAAAPKHGQVSMIRLSQPSTPPSTSHPTSTSLELFTSVPSPFPAVQYNSLVVEPSSVPPELEVLAWTEGKDGEDEVMALRHRSRPLWGVQFHPESIESSYGALILCNFFSLALSFHQSASSSTSPLPSKPDLQSDVLRLSTSHRSDVSPSIPPQEETRWELRRHELEGQQDGWTPQMVFERLVKGRSELGEVWLDSARATSEPQYSHVFVPQATWSYSIASNILTTRTSSLSSSAVTASRLPLSADTTGDFFSLLSNAHSHVQRSTLIPSPSPTSPPVGFVGSIGYEMKDVSLPLSRRARTTEEEKQETEEGGSDAELAFAASVLSYSHSSRRWSVSGLVRLDTSPSTASTLSPPAKLVESLGIPYSAWSSSRSEIASLLASAPPSPSSSSTPSPLPASLLTPRTTRSEYLDAIRSAQDLIRLGEAYELCLTTAFTGTLSPSSPFRQDPYLAYLALRQSNPAPYGAYFRLPSTSSSPTSSSPSQPDFTLLSSSPERFLRISPSGTCCMKPIKGTSRRSSDPVEDQKRRDALEADEKERAENLMIVDLIRNDLLAVCEVESVRVEGYMEVETYETVHQLVTTVTGSLLPSASPIDAVKVTFPPGSMTGAPKLRSVQLLDALEKQEKRGAYSGIFGYLSIDGSSDWSVVIRTLVRRGDNISLGAGGAITHLADPEKEWEEVLTKVEAVLGERPRETV